MKKQNQIVSAILHFRYYFLLQILHMLPVGFLSNFLLPISLWNNYSRKKTQTEQWFRILGIWKHLHLNFGKKI
jgi:hypothetical protein